MAPLNSQNLNVPFEFDLRTQHALEIQGLIQNAYSSYHEWSGPSPTTSTAILYPTAGPAAMKPTRILGPSFHVRCGSVASPSAVDSSFPLLSSPILHDNVIGISSVRPGLATPAAPCRNAGHALPHQDISGSLAAPLAPQKEPRIGERKCSAPANQLISGDATPYHEYSRSSSATLAATEPPSMVPSSHMHCDSVASPATMCSLPSLCSSGSQNVELSRNDGIAPFFPGWASDGAPSRPEGRDLAKQLGGTSSADLEATQSRRRSGKRKRKDDPRDPFATERLRIRRKEDDNCQEELYELFVPKAKGTVAKKDRLPLSTSYSLRLARMMNHCCQFSTMRKGLLGSKSVLFNTWRPQSTN
jgi:hypothetical protein